MKEKLPNIEIDLREIGSRIQSIRKRVGKRQQDLNNALGKSENYMSKVESGSMGNFGIDVAIGIGDELGVSTADFLDKKVFEKSSDQGCTIEGKQLTQEDAAYRVAAKLMVLPKAQQLLIEQMIGGLMPVEQPEEFKATGTEGAFRPGKKNQ